MTTLPAASDLGGSPTQGTFKTKIQDLRNFVADLLGTDSTNKVAARSALGLTATGEALAIAASKEAARTAIDLPSTLTAKWGHRVAVNQALTALPLIGPDLGLRNAVINGDFRLARRGTSIASPNGAYTLDRWLGFCGAGNTMTYSRQAHALGAIPGEAQYYLRMEKTAGASSAPEAHQRIESVRSFAGKTVAVGFWARADSARSVIVGITQVFGTGGSPSASVNAGAGQTQALTTSWAFYSRLFTIPSIAGKTLGSDLNDYLDLSFVWATNANGNIDISDVQIEEGDVSTPFERRPDPIEEMLASRYYWKSYDRDTAPATATAVGAHGGGIDGLNSAVHVVDVAVRFPVPMRKAAPTITLYTAAGGSGNWTGAASATTADLGAGGLRVRATTASGTDGKVSGHVVADAEL